MVNPEHKIHVYGETCIAEYFTYQDGGGLAIRYKIEGTGEPMGKLTVNLLSANLAEDEFAVKTWSDGEKLSKAAFTTGLFVDTGKRIPTGFVEAQVWKFKTGSPQ